MAARDNGFDKQPQNINRKGRPKRGESLTDLLNEVLAQPHDETGKTKAQMVIDKIYQLAVEGESEIMLKYLFDRIDGKPLQQIEAALTHTEEIDVSRYSKEELKQLAELSRKNRS